LSGNFGGVPPKRLLASRVEDRPVAVRRRGDVRVEVVADLGQLGLWEVVDVERRAEEPELLTTEPDEALERARLAPAAEPRSV
jgi:hypothetical protein